MTLEELEDRAYRGMAMPDGLDAAEQMLFHSLRRLYAYAALVKMPVEQGRREKAELLKVFRGFRMQVKLAQHSTQLWKNIDAAANKYGRERTIENADRFVEAVYGVRLREKGD